jgi:hypothetical protein
MRMTKTRQKSTIRDQRYTMFKNKLISLISIITICPLASIDCIANAVVQSKKSYSNAMSSKGTLERESATLEVMKLHVDSFLAQGGPAGHPLITFLDDSTSLKGAELSRSDWDVIVTTMRLLGEVRAEFALVILLEYLRTSDNLSGIYNAARAIGQIGGDEAYHILVGVLKGQHKSRNSDRKKAAIVGLGFCRDKNATSLLLEELGRLDNDELARIYAAGALGMLDCGKGYMTALNGLKSGNSTILTSSMASLGLIGNASALPELKEFVRPRVSYVLRRRANFCIFMIESSQLSDDEKVDFLVNGLNQSPGSTDLVQWGTGELKRMNTPYSLKSLHELSCLPQDGALKFLAFMAGVKLRALVQ